MAERDWGSNVEGILNQLMQRTGQMAGETLELARNTATMTAMFGESRLSSALLKNLEPERLEAMAEAGHFLQDARETAGMSLQEMAESLGLSSDAELRDIESGKTLMPLEMMLRATSLIARHDPIPFLIKFMRTYNPTLEKTLEQWGILAIPKQYERERRFVNIYRQHDKLRGLTDAEFERLVNYVDSATTLVLDVMFKEKEANQARAKRSGESTSAAKPRAKAKGSAKAKPKPKPKAKAKSRTGATPRSRGRTD